MQKGISMQASIIRSIRAKAVVGACLSLFSLGLGQQLTPVGVHGQLRVEGNRIVDKNGQPVILNGMSMYAWAQQGLQFYNATAVKRLIDEWKCTVIRIPILPGSVSSQTNQVKTVVEACIANGVYAIIDWHSMENAQSGPASEFFKSMAAAYGNTPNVMYETWNEPVQESWATIKAYHEKVITAIRAVDPDNIIICGNPNWDQRSDLAAADPIKISANIAYSIHFYAATHKQQFRNYATTALSKGIALFSTEYGTSEASGSGAFDANETQLWWDFFKKNGIGSANWSCAALGETSAAFKDGTSSTGWTDSNLKPSGTLVKAFIISQYMSTVGLVSKPSRQTRYELGKGLSITTLDAGSGAYNVAGARLPAAKPIADGRYYLQPSRSEGLQNLSIIR
jgi:endoglucanase